MNKIFTIIFLLSAVTFGQYGGGDGTSENPYQISTPAHLHAVRNNLSSYFIQTADIDMTAATSSGGDYYNSGLGWEPIGNSSTKFSGNYNGQGYTITGLMINRPSNNEIGLFGYTNGSTLRDIKVVSGNYTGHSSIGGLVGYATNDVLITGCSFTGTITGNAGAGYNAAGLCGLIQDVVSVTKCNTSATVSGYGQLGGIFGNNIRSNVSKTYATGTVSGNIYIGGFGGFSNSVETNCYALGNVTGTDRIGGFIGQVSGGVSANCYSTGTVPGSGGDIGGFIGRNNGTFTNSFWDTESSGKITGVADGSSSGITGKTTAQMKTSSTFTDAGWDFSTIWSISGTNYPNLQENQNNALPVELVSFSVTSAGDKTTLFWSTATEVNNFGFHIEKSGDRSDWTIIGFIEGHGNSNSPKQYSFTDRGYVSGKVYYRLAQMDNDGSVTYSSVIEYSGDKELTFSLDQNFPNPFNPNTSIRFTLAEPSVVSLKVFTVTGERVMSVLENISLAAGSHFYTIDASQLNSGVYIYTMSDGLKTLSKKMNLLK